MERETLREPLLHHPTSTSPPGPLTLSKPTTYLANLAVTQIELVSTTLLSPLTSLLADSPHIPLSPAVILKRLTFGLLAAAYTCCTLLAALALSILIGVTLVRVWVEEPVSIHKHLHFDYTLPHPVAAVPVEGRRIPAGHEARVTLVLVMPESDYNTKVGVFQVTAEAISSTGDVVATSNQPCMLKFRSLPIQLTRTFLMGIPLVVGMRDESQKLVIDVLRYKEGGDKTEMIIVRLKPKAGTIDLPQLYEAKMMIKTQLPKRKELIYNWKWTLYVWISLYVYVLLLIILVCCFKPFRLPRGNTNADKQQPNEVGKNPRYNYRSGGEPTDDFSDALTWWRGRRRSNLNMVFPHARESILAEGSASSPMGEETSEVIDEVGDDFADSESSASVGG